MATDKFDLDGKFPFRSPFHSCVTVSDSQVARVTSPYGNDVDLAIDLTRTLPFSMQRSSA